MWLEAKEREAKNNVLNVILKNTGDTASNREVGEMCWFGWVIIDFGFRHVVK